uniref:Uncharacterized protein n=1 Tax=Glossina pallidipes TaxID=7398 RepID=A0A1A9ZHA1_GLOPL
MHTSDRHPVKMSKGRKVLAYLANATSISLECSDVESELYDTDGEFLDRQNDPQGSDDKSAIIESSDEEILYEENIDRSSDSDCKKIPNKRTRRCARFPSSSEDEGGSNVELQKEVLLMRIEEEEMIIKNKRSLTTLNAYSVRLILNDSENRFRLSKCSKLLKVVTADDNDQR